MPRSSRSRARRQVRAIGPPLRRSCDSSMIHEMATASVRDLRTRFPRVKALVDEEGEVIVTNHGRPICVLRAYVPPGRSRGAAVDYWARLRRRQPRPMTAAVRRALDDADRGER
jgi:antitoxin (DNA-binding transcriptional repressor) of toxin-antitoxin stability system